MSFTVKLDQAVGFSDAELEKLTRAVGLWSAAWNSPEFKEFVINFEYAYLAKVGRWPFGKTQRFSGKQFRWNNGLNNLQVYEKLLAGSETLNPGEDNEADLSISLDKRNVRGVIGYTYPNSRMQWIYNWYFKAYSPAEIAGNLAHEYCHKLGFDHEFKAVAGREFTVPYAVGYETVKIARALEKKEAENGVHDS